MTEHSSSDTSRLDLRALALPGGEAADRAVREVMRRVAASQSMNRLLRAKRVMLAAAVLLVAVAAGTVKFSPAEAPVSDTRDVLALWAESGHVPTNAELLAIYQGYTP